jgi:hypothetical protein
LHRYAEKFKKDVPSKDDAVDEVDDWDVIRPGHEDEFAIFDPMQITLARQAYERVESEMTAPLLEAKEKLSKPIDAPERKKIEKEIKMLERRLAVFQILVEGYAQADREKGYTREEIVAKSGLTEDEVRTTRKHIDAELMRLRPSLIL